MACIAVAKSSTSRSESARFLHPAIPAMVTPSGAIGRIAVDAMGGDLGPSEVVAAVKLALHQYGALNPITLVGDEAILKPLVTHAGLHRSERLSIFHASEV